MCASLSVLSPYVSFSTLVTLMLFLSLYILGAEQAREALAPRANVRAHLGSPCSFGRYGRRQRTTLLFGVRALKPRESSSRKLARAFLVFSFFIVVVYFFFFFFCSGYPGQLQ